MKNTANSRHPSRPLLSEAATRAASQKLQFPTVATVENIADLQAQAEADPHYNPLLTRLMNDRAAGTGLDNLTFWHPVLKVAK
jgi:hypothetical protein